MMKVIKTGHHDCPAEMCVCVCVQESCSSLLLLGGAADVFEKNVEVAMRLSMYWSSSYGGR